MPPHHVRVAVQLLRQHHHRRETPVRQLPQHHMAHRVRDGSQDDQRCPDRSAHRCRRRGRRVRIRRTGVRCLTHEAGYCQPQAAPTIPDCTPVEALRPRNQSLPSGICRSKASMSEPRSRAIAPLEHRYQSLDSGNTTPKAPSHHPKSPNARASEQGNRSPKASMPEAGVGQWVLLGCLCQSLGSGNEGITLVINDLCGSRSPNRVGSMVLLEQ